MPRRRLFISFSLLTSAWLMASPPVLAAPGPGIGNVDCTQAESFRPLAFLENTQGGPTGSNVVILTGGYLMLNYANDSGGPPGILTFFDVSNPRQPRSVRRIDNADTRQFRESHSFPVAIMGDKHYVAIQTIRGIQFWDVTDAAIASKVGNIDLPGVNAGDYENVAWQTSWQGRYLFVSGGNLGVFVVDAANPAQPTLLKTVPTGATGGFRVGPLYALGDYLVYSNMDQNGALGVLDISRADAPALLTTKKTGLPRMYSFIVSGERIYGAGRDGDFTIHSWADPSRITEVKIARIEQDSLYIATQDNFAFSGRQENFVKIDLTDEKNPRVIGQGTLGRDHQDHGQVTPMGNLIFIGNDHGTGSALFCHQTGRDVTAPTIQKVYPADGSTFQPTTSRITVAWSDYIDMRSVSPDTIAIQPAGGAPLSGIYTYVFNTLSFGPDQPLLPNTTYEIVIRAGGIKDVMGNAVASERTVRFSTGGSIVAPGGGTGGAGSGGNAASGGNGGGGGAGTGGVGGGTVGTGGNMRAGGSGGSSSMGGAAGMASGGAAGVGAGGSGGSGGSSMGGAAGMASGGAAGVGAGGSAGSGGTGGSSMGGAAGMASGGAAGVGAGGNGGGGGGGGEDRGGPSSASEANGCACRTSDSGTPSGGVLLVLFAFGLLWRLQRRQ